MIWAPTREIIWDMLTSITAFIGTLIFVVKLALRFIVGATPAPPPPRQPQYIDLKLSTSKVSLSLEGFEKGGRLSNIKTKELPLEAL